MLYWNKIGMLVFYHCHNRLLQIWWLKTTQIYYFIVPVDQAYKLAQLVSLLWVSRCQRQGVSQLGSSRRVWEKSTSKVTQTAGGIQFPVVVRLRSLCLCRLSVRPHFQLLNSICFPWLMAPFSLWTSNGNLSPSLHISPASPSASSLIIWLLPHPSALLCCPHFCY